MFPTLPLRVEHEVVEKIVQITTKEKIIFFILNYFLLTNLFLTIKQ